jgi:sugar-specific transcriptional regulator TrmB
VTNIGWSLLLSDVNELSGKTVEKTLHNFGLTEKETQIYIYLAKHGAQGAGEIASGTKTATAVIYRTLKALQRKGFAESTLESPVRYTAVPFENVLDSKIRGKQDEVRQMENSKRELLADWRKISIGKPEYPLEKFTVIEGDNKIFAKIFKMVRETKSQLSTFTTIAGLKRADRYGIFDAINNHPLRSKVEFRIITDLTRADLTSARFLKKRLQRSIDFRARNPELGLRLCPRIVIKDEEEIVFFIDSRKGDFASERDDVYLWTNCKSLVHAFLAMFEELWRNSTDIEKKIVEIETGKPTPETYVITDAETARKKYNATIRSAKEEILMLTSARGLIECREDIILFEEQAKRKVTIKIMAPIMNENFEAANQLSKHFEVKHVPVSYLRTTIIDGKHLFQFKNPPSGQEIYEATPYYEDAFYSADPEYVDKTKAMMNDMWENAHALSPITLASVLRIDEPKAAADSEERRFSIYRKTIARIKDEKLGAKTEKEVLKEFILAKKYPAESSQNRAYCSIGHAIIHPPKYFKLPLMMLKLYHFEKQSTLGAEDILVVYLWLKTPAEYTFVPAAVIQDNPRVTDHYKVWFAGTPAGDNVHLIEKDELQIRIHGNTLFAVWTVPIPLSSYPAIPPSCIIMEGYGNIKTGSYTIILPSGYKFKHQTNGLDAFVTFMHPTSKYTGPGTDGYFARDAIIDIYPP